MTAPAFRMPARTTAVLSCPLAGRRREVGLGTLKTLAILATLCAGAPGAGAVADEGKPPAEAQNGNEARSSEPVAAEPKKEPKARPEPPVPPRRYLEAAIRLFNKGKLDLAGTYLNAAQAYRDRLTGDEQIVLDVYRERHQFYTDEQKQPKQSPAAPEPGKKPRTDSGVVATSTAAKPPLNLAADPIAPEPGPLEGQNGAGSLMEKISLPAGPAGDLAPLRADGLARTKPSENPPSSGAETWRDPGDNKQKARWLLQKAREQIFKGKLDAAEELINQADAMKIKWGYFDDTPARVAETLKRARGKGTIGSKSYQSHDRHEARIKLRSARDALATGEIDKAEETARDVLSWNLRYGFFDDTPEKVVAAIADARRRLDMVNAELTVKSYLAPNSTRTDDKNVERASAPLPKPLEAPAGR
jgi:hypothetical protein